MILLAGPMLVLFIFAEIIARFVDKTRGRGDGTDQWADDQQSPL